MFNGRLHITVAWLCLTLLGLSNVLFAGGGVLCRDPDGHARVEWGCDRNASNECLGNDGAAADAHARVAQPCQDVPIDGGQQFTKAPAPELASAEAVPPPAATFVTPVFVGPARRLPVVERNDALRPPDTLLRLRTVVILV